MKYYLSIIFFLLLCGTTLNAQDENFWFLESQEQNILKRDKEFSIYEGVGLSGLTYALNTGKRQGGLGLQFGLGFRIGLSKYFSTWSLLTGVELSLYQTTFELDNLSTYSHIIDMDGENLEFRNIVNTHKEIQRSMLIQIPLMLHFQTDAGRACEFYCAMGGKVGIPVFGRYKTSLATIKNTGYHAYTGSEFDTQQFMGFGTFTDRKNDGKLMFNTAFFASIETGVKFPMRSTAVYVGAYLDYGLNNIYQTSDRAFVEYNIENPRNFRVNSITQSVYTQSGQSQAFTEKIMPMAVGIKVQLAF